MEEEGMGKKAAVSSPDDTETPNCQHPLEIPVILHELFTYFRDTNDLNSVKSIRLVSKAWKDASTFLWNTYAIPFRILSKDPDGLCEESLGQVTSVSRLLNKEGTSKDSSNSKLRHHYFVLESWSMWDIVNIRFWDPYGPNITRLTLRGCTFPFNPPFLFPASLLQKLSNMESLSLIDCRINMDVELDEGRRVCAYYQMKNRVEAERKRFRAQYPRRQTLSDLDEARIEEQIRESLELAFHGKLKCLRLNNIKFMGTKTRIPWFPLLVVFSNLEHISFHHRKMASCAPQVNDLFRALDGSRVGRRLKHLDYMENLTVDDDNSRDDVRLLYDGGILRLKWSQFTLSRLYLDLGLRARQDDLQKILESQSSSLQELRLFRLPLKVSFKIFPCMVTMPRLQELHLWGNPSVNLDFLQLMPVLRVLKWNTSFYDKKSYGARLFTSINWEKTIPDPLFTGKLVKNTEGLENFNLSCMETLEAEWGPISVDCWKRLGKWFPNLKDLKGTVKGDKELSVIGEQWPELEHLQFAHGSLVSVQGILETFSNMKLFQNLHSFIWEPCPCNRALLIRTELKTQAENVLKEQLGNDVLVPWKENELMDEEEASRTECIQDLYEKALVTGGESAKQFLEMFKAFNNRLS